MSSSKSKLADEKGELQKQLGCMNGIFQLFDRRYFLGQRNSAHNHNKKLPPPPGQSGTDGIEFKNAPDKAMEKDPKKVAKDKQRFSVESSRTSFSSTCSSIEPPCSGKSIFLEASTTPIIPIEQPTPFKTLDLRDVVKDSMYREARGVPVKTMAKDEGMSQVMKHIDSPRPLQHHRSVQIRAYSHDKSNRSLREVSGNFKEEKDAPRFSYDGRESRDKFKSSVRPKELPRLSLDSRESTIRRSAIESRKNFLRDTPRSNETSGQSVNQDQEPGSNKRPSGVVARLMGLEALPDPSTPNQGEDIQIKPHQDDVVTISTSSGTGKEVKHSQISGSPRNSLKAPASPRKVITSKVTKAPLNSRLPLEPAPWRQEGGSQRSRKPALISKESPTTSPQASSSVYGEIEKRLTELGFKKSGKDLRALKQILEAMQKTRKRLENAEQPLDFEFKSSKCSNPDYGSWDQNSHPVSPSIKGTSPQKRGEFPIMVIKPAKFIGKPRISDSKKISGLQKLRTEKFADDRNNHLRDPSGEPLPSTDKKANAITLGPTQSSKVPENITRERLNSSKRTFGSGSPRLQVDKQGMEKQSSPSTLSSDFSRVRKQSIKQPLRSDCNRKAKSKSRNSQKSDDQSCGFSRETRNMSQQGDTVSIQSESNTSLASQNDTEVTSRDWTCKISTCQPYDYNDSKCAARFSEDCPITELVTSTMEQPSPVSVLDATFYGEDSPSPVKKISNAFKDYDTLTCDEAEWNQEGMDHFLNSKRTSFWSEFNHDKLENIRHLVHRITLLNATHTEATSDDTAPPCENRHPDHIYITKIFLASGFLELGSNTVDIQLHSTGHLLDRNLFHVLEKTNECTGLANHELHEESVGLKSRERNRRKLIFDTVDEILVRKLALTGSPELWTRSNKAQGRRLSGDKLLEEVWSEINNLHANSDSSLDDEDDELIRIISTDVNKKSADWEGQRNELPGLVLDIERLIFKDLISEVVSGGVAGLLDPPGRHCKQLFSN